MAGASARPNQCAVCGGRLKTDTVTIPFLLNSGVVIIKDVPAEVCRSCREPFTLGPTTDRITALLNQLSAFPAEVAVITYTEKNLPPAPMEEE